ncbi:MAG: hypothetical protein QW587_06450 [Candidatus Bathyarchaeia archaeon]
MRAVSAIVSTIIVIAVTVSVAAAFWSVDVTRAFTGVERLELVTAYADVASSPSDGFNVTLIFRNAGSVAVSLDNVVLNEKPWTHYPTGTVHIFESNTAALGEALSEADLANHYQMVPGDEKSMVIWLKNGGVFTSGTSLGVTLHTSSGREYPKTVRLP